MLILLSFLTFPILCVAQVIPTAPGPGETFKAGTECTVKWKPDTSGKWDSFDIGEDQYSFLFRRLRSSPLSINLPFTLLPFL